MRLPSSSGFCVCIWYGRIEREGDRSSVEAWYSTAIYIEECAAGDEDVRHFVADMVNFFDSVYPVEG